MFFNIAIFSCFVAAAVANPLVRVAKVSYADPVAPAQYEYKYHVHDSKSGDVKQQEESRNGDIVKGSYSFLQPDGTRRIVEYTADKEHGFKAVVRYEGTPNVRHEGTPKTYSVIESSPAKISYVTTPSFTASVKPYSSPTFSIDSSAAKVSYVSTPDPYAASSVAKLAPVPFTAPINKIEKFAPFSPDVSSVSFSTPTYSYHHSY